MVTDVAEENSAGETNSDPIVIENDWVSTEIKPVTDYYIGYVTYNIYLCYRRSSLHLRMVYILCAYIILYRLLSLAGASHP